MFLSEVSHETPLPAFLASEGPFVSCLEAPSTIHEVQILKLLVL